MNFVQLADPPVEGFMGFVAYYIIRARVELLDLLRKSFPSLVDDFSALCTWSKEEGGRTTWQSEDHARVVKASWLLSFLKLQQDDVVAAMRSALGEAPHSISLFDKWWTLERVEVDDTVEAVIATLNPDDFEALDSGGDSVLEGWLRNHRKRTEPLV